MADARALLRAHRAEHRIKHPHAAYSDAGKLLCKLCHEPVKSDTLWDGHIRGPNHRRKLQALQSQATSTEAPTNITTTTSKRKLGEVDDTTWDAAEEELDSIRTKRSRTNIGGNGSGSGGVPTPISTGNGKEHTPPLFSRRTSNTPVQGVEIAIPSRPATPQAGSHSSTSTPKGTAPLGRSPLISDSSDAAAAAPSSTATPPTSAPISTQPLTTTTTTSQQGPSNHLPQAPQQTSVVDEAEWAAFEASMAAEDNANVNNSNSTGPATSSVYAASATISAPALTAEQAAAKSQEEANERRKQLQDLRDADEREDATRALEAEFEEMAELEGRVRRLKERREELRRGSGTGVDSTAGKTSLVGKENANSTGGGDENDEEEEEDDDEEDLDLDEWDAFRFRV
ncbi:hypothetical protein F4779DRAFT_582514 [Xylariaceae sp. FL0662B]|nr:hypothetical protein F4779DRAFT_582514 [Xylariaceae sp. FL0662B]